jgi:hypothetical protein
MTEIIRRIISGRERLPNRRASERFSFEHGGLAYTATISRYSDGRPGEIFLDCNKVNSAAAVHAQDSAVLASLLLQHGVSAATIRHSISGPIATALAMIGGQP